MQVLGLDIGANNIKAVILRKESDHIKSETLQLKRHSTSSLVDDLHYCKAYLRINKQTNIFIANSITGYYESNQLGLTVFNQILTDVFAEANMFHVTIDGECVAICQTDDYPIYHFMGTNAYGSAYLAAKLFANGLLIDMGTSSTDIISIIDHEPKMIAAKHQNRNRLATGELSFSGLLYTQIEYLLHEVPFAGVTAKICPGIAWTGHVYALLGKINAATMEPQFKSEWNYDDAHYRLARMLCYDDQLVSHLELVKVSRFIHEKQIEHMQDMVEEVRRETKVDIGHTPIIACGIGTPIITEKLVEKVGTKMFRLMEETNIPSENCLSAFGVAIKGLDYMMASPLSKEMITDIEWRVQAHAPK